METHVLEGTVAEVRQRLTELPVPAETRVRLIVEAIPEREEPARFRNGVMLVPIRDPSKPVTTELVRELLDTD